MEHLDEAAFPPPLLPQPTDGPGKGGRERARRFVGGLWDLRGDFLVIRTRLDQGQL